MTEQEKPKAKDENDKARDGTLPEDPHDDVHVVARGPRLHTVRDLLVGSMNRARRARQQRAGTTGNRKLDDITGGLRPGFVWTMGAETSWGKSSFAISVADENLKSGARVLIVSTEDAPSVYGDRLLARRANLNAKRLRDAQLTPEEFKQMVDVVANAEPLPVYMDAIGKPAEWVLEFLPAIVKEYGIDIVLVDYLQEMRSKQRHQDRRLELAYIAGSLRAMIKRMGLSGILFSQITAKEGVRPGKYSMRDSQDITNGAEVVAVGYTPEKDMETKSAGLITAGTKCLLIDKNKDGPKGVVPMHWDEHSASFRDEPDALYDAISDLHSEFGNYQEPDQW